MITVASLVQAEGSTHDDFGKVARVVYNRLKPTIPRPTGSWSSTPRINYIKGQSKLDISINEIDSNINDPYNTYMYKGLPPGPIGNPGQTRSRRR